jgi:hypothetical protein
MMQGLFASPAGHEEYHIGQEIELATISIFPNSWHDLVPSEHILNFRSVPFGIGE